HHGMGITRARPDRGATDMLVTFTITSGPRKGQQFSFAEHDTFVVGRSRHARLSFLDKALSRFHFLVEIHPPHCRVGDVHSFNGTYVNRERVDSANLKHGDKIRAGDIRFRVEIVEASVAEAAEGHSPAPVRPTATLASQRSAETPARTLPRVNSATAPT